MTVPLIIDTDTAGDDCVAILEGLLDPEANLVGITMCAGNVSFSQQLKNAFLTLNAAGRLGEVPVHPGASLPLSREWHSAAEVFGDGVGGLTADMGDSATPSKVTATEALIEASKKYEGQLKVICIAPLTNIALAIQADPDFAKRVQRFYVMGGSNNGRGNVTAAAEYNFYVDPEAADILFRSGASITVVTWDPITLRDALFDEQQRNDIAELGTPLSRFFESVNRDALAFDMSVGIPGSTHPDSITCAIALHPELALKTAPYNVQIEINSDLTRGYSAMSWGVHGLPANADIVEEASNKDFHWYLMGLLKNPIDPNVPFGSATSAPSSGMRKEPRNSCGYHQHHLE